MWESGEEAAAIVEAKGLKQISDSSAIEGLVDGIIAGNPGQVAQFKGGNEKILGWFVGQVMKATQGKANPGLVNEVLRKKLGSRTARGPISFCRPRGCRPEIGRASCGERVGTYG